MLHRQWLAAAALLAGIFACTDRSAPTAPPGGGAGRSGPAATAAHTQRMERLARRFAIALGNPRMRAQVHGSIQRSPYPERKLHFQGLLANDHRRILRDMARASGDSEAEIQEDAANVLALEVYLPVAEHRARWSGDENILVAAAIADGDTPVAFDTRGNRYLLDPIRPPATPVLAVVPVETDFSAPARLDKAICTIETCPPTGGGGGGSGGGPGGSPAAPGLYLSYSHVTQTYESWLKGNPELEIHVLGQVGQTDSLKSYQCTGEHAGGPYTFDQNGLDWTGNALLFSQAQLDSYRAQHSGQSLRVFVLEDDDTACDIRSGANTFEGILAAVDTAYNVFTGGKDSTSGPAKYFQRARSFQKVLQKLAQLIKTNDDLVGNAVEDVVVGQYYSGANWIVKGQNNVTNGWMKLTMK